MKGYIVTDHRKDGTGGEYIYIFYDRETAIFVAKSQFNNLTDREKKKREICVVEVDALEEYAVDEYFNSFEAAYYEKGGNVICKCK